MPNIVHYLNEQQRYILSVILSFLNENDGTSLLITNKTWTYRILPMFQLLINKHDNGSSIGSSIGKEQVNNNIRKLKQARHLFIVIPVEDSNILLARLNTRRLANRIRTQRRKVNGNKKQCRTMINNQGCCYPINMNTNEIAWHEWNQSRLYYNTYDHLLDHNDNQDGGGYHPIDSRLELLRYRTPPPTYKIPNQITPLPPKLLPNTTLLTSYPRSGNSLFRNLIERITNMVTGSDTRPDRTLSKALAVDHHLIGEGIVHSSMTPVIKTHFPERKGYAVYYAQRIILLVRNPYDAIDSYWNMCCTNTHTESVVEDIYDLYREKFENLAKNEICTWLKFVKYWLRRGNTVFNSMENNNNNNNNKGSNREERPSLLVIRFEDLILQTASVMEQIMSFMIYDDPQKELHPFWKWRINHGLNVQKQKVQSTSSKLSKNEIHVAVEKVQESVNTLQQSVNTLQLGSYRPRSEQHNRLASIGKSIRKGRYSEEILKYFEDMAKQEDLQIDTKEGKWYNLLELFNYDITINHFPENICTKEHCWTLKDFMTNTKDENQSNVMINAGPELRPNDSEFGRAMTNWRKSQTCNDKVPFSTVVRK